MSPDLAPTIDAWSEPYWSGLREGVLRMPKCRGCGHLQFPMGPCCSECLNREFDWVQLGGGGTVHAFVVYHHAFHPSLKDRIPYNVAEIALDEGVHVISNLIGIDNDRIANGMRVTARFEPVDDTLTLLRFQPTAA